jgi:hypothetical protein
MNGWRTLDLKRLRAQLFFRNAAQNDFACHQQIRSAAN